MPTPILKREEKIHRATIKSPAEFSRIVKPAGSIDNLYEKQDEKASIPVFLDARSMLRRVESGRGPREHTVRVACSTCSRPLASSQCVVNSIVIRASELLL